MPFTVERLPDTDIIFARISGLFSSAHASSLMQAYAALLKTPGRSGDASDLLVDVGEAPIQSAKVVQALTAFLRRPGLRPTRIAFVHGDKPVKLQARRVSAELGGRHFVTVEEAMAWLGGKS